jgi:hypothetical protein
VVHLRHYGKKEGRHDPNRLSPSGSPACVKVTLEFWMKLWVSWAREAIRRNTFSISFRILIKSLSRFPP